MRPYLVIRQDLEKAFNEKKIKLYFVDLKFQKR